MVSAPERPLPPLPPAAPAAVVAIVCGLPGSGKSTLCASAPAAMAEATATARAGPGCGVVTHHVCLDALEREARGGGGGGSPPFDREAWRESRGAALERVDGLLRTVAAAVGAGVAGDEVEGGAQPVPVPVLVLVDDTMHLRSMRHAYWRLARDRGAGFVVVHVDASPDACWARNAARDASTRVPEDAFLRVRAAFEAPGSEPWESGDALVRVRDGDLAAVWPQLGRAMARPPPAPPEPAARALERRAEGAAANASSAAHAVDALARRLVGAAVAAAPANLRHDLAAELNALRKDALAAVRRGARADEALAKLRARSHAHL